MKKWTNQRRVASNITEEPHRYPDLLDQSGVKQVWWPIFSVLLVQFFWMHNLCFQQTVECHQPSRGHFSITTYDWPRVGKHQNVLRYYCNRKPFVFPLDNTCRCVTAVCVSSFLFLLMQSFFQLTTVTLQPEYNCKIHLSLHLSVFQPTCLSDWLADKISVCQIFYPSVCLTDRHCLPTCLSDCLYTCLPVCLPFCIPNYISTPTSTNHLPVPLCADHLSISLFACLSAGTSWQKALTQLGLVR